MASEDSSTGSGLIPDDLKRELSLPSDMVSRGLELAIKIERKHGIEKYQKPIIKFPGLLNGSCIDFSGNGEIVAITSYGKQKENPGLLIWNVVNRILSVFPEAGFRKAAPSHFIIEHIPSDEQMGVTKESSPISEIKMFVTETRYKPIGDPESTPRGIYSVALSKCGDLALIGYGDSSISRCNVNNDVIRNYSIIAKTQNAREVSAIAISPDNRFFAECSGFHIRIRDTMTGELIKKYPGHNPYYNQIAFSDDGNKILIANGMHSEFKGGELMTLLDVSGKTPPVIFDANRLYNITAVTIFPDNQKIVSIDNGGVVTVWNATNGNEISHWRHTKSDVNDVIETRQLPGHLRVVMRNPIIWGLSSVAVSSSGKRILSGGGDNYMRLWSLTGHELWEYPHDSRVVKVSFLPDCKRALSGCWDGSVYLWELP